MKRFGIIWSGVRTAVSRVHPVDRWLLVFACVLLGQSIYSLFSPAASEPAQHIDTMVRTSLAAIFGYFLSANFNRREPPVVKPAERGSISQQQPDPQNTAEEQPAPDLFPALYEENGDRPQAVTCLQVLLSAAIGLVCLVPLLALRFFPDLAEQAFSGSAAATVTQFRDLVSSCIGFLIGCPVHCKD